MAAENATGAGAAAARWFGVLGSLRRWSARFQQVAEVVGGILFLLMFGVFVVQIIARGVFGRPLAWSDEIAVVLYLWVIVWASALVVPSEQQVQFDLLWNLVGPRAQRGLRIVGHGLVGALSLAALPATWDYVHFMAREGTPVLNIPFMWVFLPLVLLVAALVVRSALGLLEALLLGTNLMALAAAPSFADAQPSKEAP